MMVINEKVLLKLMARDYKDDEYTVAVYGEDSNGDPYLFLHGTEWEVEMEWAKVPDKVLALIVQHMRKLPAWGQAFTICKGEEPTAISVTWYTMHEPGKDETQVPIKRTPIHYDDFSVWQKTGNNGISFAGGMAADLILDHGRNVLYVEGGLYLAGAVSRVYVDCRTFLQEANQTKAVNYLAKHEWV